MSHVRQQIREAVATVLTGLTTSGARVFQSRLRVLSDADLPCLLINTDDESIDTPAISHAAMQERELQLLVRAVAKNGASVDDLLDTMLAEVETAMTGQTLGGIAKGLVLEKISIEMNDELEKPIGIASATYRVTYYTADGAPGTAL